MLDKLIRILKSGGVLRGLPATAADRILGALRCDECRHWDHESSLSDAGRKGCKPLEIWGLETAPDFFCAMWEPKDQ